MSTQHRIDSHVYHTALGGVTLRDQIHYTQGPKRWEGIDKQILGPAQPHNADCSAYTTWLFWQARKHVLGAPGLDIINHAEWKAGYTGTQIENGKRHRLGVRFWYPGRTLVFYGNPTVGHVAVYVGNGRVVSHGSEAGPLYLPWNYRSDFNQARSYAS